ncbi:MAG: hypothetical protein OQJ93_01505 [Ignavibacteriaceae bacterium]|jgi:hypothetical protein|nr:hypothetical protein [Ignavibacteriaceae bacterium]MCW8812438.1 hypothetical protein [Chlorobium sp.]MCW8818592.1 hypothetical protein [Ignavibacteriaceae bacterium]MCW8824680.1 hypothetical protein [Ignavibacteriaceae bacterium]MCW8960732.1 hypothetical protein [Ignavibacteriaceae bacterium]
MATPKVNLRQRKARKRFSYFVDFAIDGKRFRLVAVTNKKLAQEV